MRSPAVPGAGLELEELPELLDGLRGFGVELLEPELLRGLGVDVLLDDCAGFEFEELFVLLVLLVPLVEVELLDVVSAGFSSGLAGSAGLYVDSSIALLSRRVVDVEDITLSSAELKLPELIVLSVLATEVSVVFSLSAHPAVEAVIIKIDIASKIGFINFFIPILLKFHIYTIISQKY